uniref:CCC domain-containing protein n=2 Tax=Stomoxys calcitrans TaxID=35570 RepID=A0A1I8NR89_STOCA
MLNNVVLSMTRSRRQQHHHPPHHVAEEREEGGREGGTVSSSSSPFLMKPLRMLLLMLMVLSAAATYIQPSMAESETNDLNSLEPKEPVTMSLKPISAKLETRQHPNAAQYMPQSQLPATLPGCPLCDSSVYSYCSHKLIHDTCCCDYP